MQQHIAMDYGLLYGFDLLWLKYASLGIISKWYNLIGLTYLRKLDD